MTELEEIECSFSANKSWETQRQSNENLPLMHSIDKSQDEMADPSLMKPLIEKSVETSEFGLVDFMSSCCTFIKKYSMVWIQWMSTCKKVIQTSLIFFLGCVLLTFASVAEYAALQDKWSAAWIVTLSLILQISWLYFRHRPSNNSGQAIYPQNLTTSLVESIQTIAPDIKSEKQLDAVMPMVLNAFGPEKLNTISQTRQDNHPSNTSDISFHSTNILLKVGSRTEELFLRTRSDTLRFNFELVDLALPLAFLYVLTTTIPLIVITLMIRTNDEDKYHLSIIPLVILSTVVLLNQSYRLLISRKNSYNEIRQTFLMSQPSKIDKMVSSNESMKTSISSDNSLYHEESSRLEEQKEHVHDHKNIFGSQSTSAMTVVVGPVMSDENLFSTNTLAQYNEGRENQLFGEFINGDHSLMGGQTDSAGISSSTFIYLSGNALSPPITNLWSALIDLFNEWHRELQLFMNILRSSSDFNYICILFIGLLLFTFASQYGLVIISLIWIYGILTVLLKVTLHTSAIQTVFEKQPVLMEFNILIVEFGISSLFLLLSIQQFIFESIFIPESLLWKINLKQSNRHMTQCLTIIFAVCLRVLSNRLSNYIFIAKGIQLYRVLELICAMLWFLLFEYHPFISLSLLSFISPVQHIIRIKYVIFGLQYYFIFRYVLVLVLVSGLIYSITQKNQSFKQHLIYSKEHHLLNNNETEESMIIPQSYPPLNIKKNIQDKAAKPAVNFERSSLSRSISSQPIKNKKKDSYNIYTQSSLDNQLTMDSSCYRLSSLQPPLDHPTFQSHIMNSFQNSKRFSQDPKSEIIDGDQQSKNTIKNVTVSIPNHHVQDTPQTYVNSTPAISPLQEAIRRLVTCSEHHRGHVIDQESVMSSEHPVQQQVSLNPIVLPPDKQLQSKKSNQTSFFKTNKMMSTINQSHLANTPIKKLCPPLPPTMKSTLRMSYPNENKVISNE